MNTPVNAQLLLDETNEAAVRRGTVISVKHPMVFEPVLNVIQNVEGDNIYFRVPEIFLVSNVLKGDSVTCQVLNDGYEYVLEGIISDIDIHYPRLVQVCIDRVYRYKNNRRNKRYLVSFQANVHSPGSDKKIYAVIKNISNQGIGAIFKECINMESTVGIKVSASISKNEYLEFKAKIVRALPRESYNEYGMEITEIDDYNKDVLDRLIYHLGENEDRYISRCLK